jgi:hypothetical protein
VVGSLDDDHAEADAPDPQASDRVAGVKRVLVRACLGRDLPLDCREVAARRARVLCLDTTLVAVRQSVLLDVRVQRSERVLPLPDDDDPGERDYARDDQQDADDAAEEPH